MQIFSSTNCVQQLIIPKQLNQIYIVAHHCIKFKGRSSTCERKSAVEINTISPISIDRSTQSYGLIHNKCAPSRMEGLCGQRDQNRRQTDKSLWVALGLCNYNN